MEICLNGQANLYQSANFIENPIKLKKPKIRNRIRYCRTAINLGQKEMAFLMGVPQPRISEWENGAREPGVYNAIGLATVTHRMVEDVFFDYRRQWQEKINERKKLFDSKKKVEKNFYPNRKIEKT